MDKFNPLELDDEYEYVEEEVSDDEYVEEEIGEPAPIIPVTQIKPNPIEIKLKRKHSVCEDDRTKRTKLEGTPSTNILKLQQVRDLMTRQGYQEALVDAVSKLAPQDLDDIFKRLVHCEIKISNARAPTELILASSELVSMIFKHYGIEIEIVEHTQKACDNFEQQHMMNARLESISKELKELKTEFDTTPSVLSVSSIFVRAAKDTIQSAITN